MSDDNIPSKIKCVYQNKKLLKDQHSNTFLSPSLSAAHDGGQNDLYHFHTKS